VWAPAGTVFGPKLDIFQHMGASFRAASAMAAPPSFDSGNLGAGNGNSAQRWWASTKIARL